MTWHLRLYTYDYRAGGNHRDVRCVSEERISGLDLRYEEESVRVRLRYVDGRREAFAVYDPDLVRVTSRRVLFDIYERVGSPCRAYVFTRED